MAFPTSFAQNPEYSWAPARRRDPDYFPAFAAVLGLLLFVMAFAAPTRVDIDDAPLHISGP